MIQETVANSKKKPTLKDYKKSILVKSFYKFVANNNLREVALRGLIAARNEKARINKKTNEITTH